MSGSELTTIFGVCCAVAFPFIAIFGGIAFWAWRSGKQVKAEQEATRSWASTTGRVIKSRAEVLGGGRSGAIAVVLYEYVVNGKTYSSDVVRIGGPSATSSAYAVVDRYPEGATVTVYYNPADPSEAALERGI